MFGLWGRLIWMNSVSCPHTEFKGLPSVTWYLQFEDEPKIRWGSPPRRPSLRKSNGELQVSQRNVSFVSSCLSDTKKCMFFVSKTCCGFSSPFSHNLSVLGIVKVAFLHYLDYPPKKIDMTCPPKKRDHFKPKFHLPTTDFQWISLFQGWYLVLVLLDNCGPGHPGEIGQTTMIWMDFAPRRCVGEHTLGGGLCTSDGSVFSIAREGCLTIPNRTHELENISVWIKKQTLPLADIYFGKLGDYILCCEKTSNWRCCSLEIWDFIWVKRSSLQFAGQSNGILWCKSTVFLGVVQATSGACQNSHDPPLDSLNHGTEIHWFLAFPEMEDMGSRKLQEMWNGFYIEPRYLRNISRSKNLKEFGI